MENYLLGAASILVGILVVVFHKQFANQAIRFWSKIHKYSERETKFQYILYNFIGIGFVILGIFMIVRQAFFSG